jgi:hypothetical protein
MPGQDTDAVLDSMLSMAVPGAMYEEQQVVQFNACNVVKEQQVVQMPHSLDANMHVPTAYNQEQQVVQFNACNVVKEQQVVQAVLLPPILPSLDANMHVPTAYNQDVVRRPLPPLLPPAVPPTCSMAPTGNPNSPPPGHIAGAPPLWREQVSPHREAPSSMPLTSVPVHDSSLCGTCGIVATVPKDSLPPSIGSAGHPHHCKLACKFVHTARGCKDGANCERCHLCPWRRSHKIAAQACAL